MSSQSPFTGQVRLVQLNLLIADPDQPRKTFAEDSLQELANSIAKSGVLVPLLVRRGEGHALIIHDGERRYRAAQMVGYEALPVIVMNASDNLRFEQLAMNNLREHLKPMEVARMLADMQRKGFASTNDLAAHLDRAGLPALTPKQIDETIALVDLPDWLQGMIDAQQIEVPAALQAQTVAHLPEVLASVQEDIEDEIKMGGKATARDVDYIITATARAIGMDLSTDDWRSNPPHFNPKRICKGCEFKLAAGRTTYCMNPPEFERKNAEAKAAGLLPGGKKPKKPSPGAVEEIEETKADEKALSRADTLKRKAQEYLHAYLVQKIVAAMVDNIDIDITDELLTWHAMRQPGQSSYGGRAALAPYRASEALRFEALENLFMSIDIERAQRAAAVEVVTELKWRETQVICHYLWGSSIEKVWAMNEDFTRLFRKAELLQLVADHSLELDGDRKWEKLKQGDLRKELLDRKGIVIRPKILQQVYADVDEPWVPYSYRADEDFEEVEEEEEAA